MAGLKDEVVKKTAPTNAAAGATPAQASTAAATASTGGSAQTAQKSTLKGVSAQTGEKLNQYAQGYAPGSNVQAAQNYLSGVLNQKPVADPQLAQLYDKIMNREDFSYDLNGDMLYQQYKEQYQQAGKQAMMDTMGNATALTGGYGNSYASTAGNQAYQQYLQQLNNIVPDLYQAAYDRYRQEGTDLQNQYSLAYGQYRDQLGDWENERDYANSEYWNQHSADYADYQNMLSYWNQQAQQENAAYYTERDYAYNLAMAMIQKKKMPSDEILAAAGLTQADAKKLGAKTGSSGGGSSRRRSTSSGAGLNSEPVSESGAKKAAGNVGLNSWAHFYYKK